MDKNKINKLLADIENAVKTFQSDKCEDLQYEIIDDITLKNNDYYQAILIDHLIERSEALSIADREGIILNINEIEYVYKGLKILINNMADPKRIGNVIATCIMQMVRAFRKVLIFAPKNSENHYQKTFNEVSKLVNEYTLIAANYFAQYIHNDEFWQENMKYSVVCSESYTEEMPNSMQLVNSYPMLTEDTINKINEMFPDRDIFNDDNILKFKEILVKEANQCLKSAVANRTKYAYNISYYIMKNPNVFEKEDPALYGSACANVFYNVRDKIYMNYYSTSDLNFEHENKIERDSAYEIVELVEKECLEYLNASVYPIINNISDDSYNYCRGAFAETQLALSTVAYNSIAPYVEKYQKLLDKGVNIVYDVLTGKEIIATNYIDRENALVLLADHPNYVPHFAYAEFTKCTNLSQAMHDKIYNDKEFEKSIKEWTAKKEEYINTLDSYIDEILELEEKNRLDEEYKKSRKQTILYDSVTKEMKRNSRTPTKSKTSTKMNKPNTATKKSPTTVSTSTVNKKANHTTKQHAKSKRIHVGITLEESLNPKRNLIMSIIGFLACGLFVAIYLLVFTEVKNIAFLDKYLAMPKDQLLRENIIGIIGSGTGFISSIIGMILHKYSVGFVFAIISIVGTVLSLFI